MTQTNYTREIADTICSRMTEGFSLRAICRELAFRAKAPSAAGQCATLTISTTVTGQRDCS